MTLLELLALAQTGVLAIFILATLRSWHRLLGRAEIPGELIPMTIIRPLKGLDDGLAENLRATIEADKEGVLQHLFAVESEDDPAFPVARDAAALAPGRARVVITGPIGDRMGKAHNMIESLKHADHEFVVFSDSDARADRAVLVETARAFREGADAVSGLPDASRARSFGDVFVCLCFNHYFVPLAVAASGAGIGTYFSGTWMGLRRSTLQSLGGLERFSNAAADDFSLAEALRRSGARVALLPRFVPLLEKGGSPLEAITHVFKWARIARWTTPIAFALLPLATPLPIAILAILDPRFVPAWLALAALRVVSAVLADRRAAETFFPAWTYLALPALDLLYMGFWFAAWPARTVVWRGRRYRLRPGGRLEPLAA